ncbi:HAD-IA family hydrolase [Ancylobacter sp. IITR112]|uniref:HAD-IA family hydrolase n=1 Tax=Ancylobacter sp. IITR112 TaxID=3138073 RepID=UPI00352A5C6A
MRPALLIFDCDGVLIDSELLAARALIDALAGHGVAVDLGFVARHFIGRAQGAIRTEVTARFGVELPGDFEEAYRHRLLASFEAGLKPVAGAVEALAALDVPFCLATSSSPPRLAASLRLVGLERVFAGRAFTAAEVARGKPAPDLFLHAAARMGAAPASCVVVEDSAPGVMAGLAAGMEVWHFTGGGHFAAMDLPLPAGTLPHRHFDSFASLRAARADLFHAPAGAADPTPA